jgi:hypothetical protein
MNWLQELFITYEGKDLTNTDKIKGATQAEIKRLEKLSGETLPDDYRLFLEICGNKLPSFIDTCNISLEISELISQYELTLEEEPDEMPESEWLIVAVWNMTGAEWVLNTVTGKVYERDEYGEMLLKVTDSFRKIIHQHAFTYYKLHESKYVKSVSSGTSDLEKKYNEIDSDQLRGLVVQCLRRHNLSILDISDIRKQCASGDHIYFINTLYLEESPDNSIKKVGGIPFKVGGEIEAEVIALAEDMRELIAR